MKDRLCGGTDGLGDGWRIDEGNISSVVFYNGEWRATFANVFHAEDYVRSWQNTENVTNPIVLTPVGPRRKEVMP